MISRRNQDGSITRLNEPVFGGSTTPLERLLNNTMRAYDSNIGKHGNKESAAVSMSYNIVHLECKILIDHCDFVLEEYHGTSTPEVAKMFIFE